MYRSNGPSSEHHQRHQSVNELRTVSIIIIRHLKHVIIFELDASQQMLRKKREERQLQQINQLIGIRVIYLFMYRFNATSERVVCVFVCVCVSGCVCD